MKKTKGYKIMEMGNSENYLPLGWGEMKLIDLSKVFMVKMDDWD